MKAILRISLTVVLLLSFIFVGGDRARGFSYFTYGGYTVIWAGGQSLRYLSPGTFPEGSDTDLLIQASMGQWSSVWGAGFQFSYYRLPEDPAVIDPYDGYSDTAAVPAEWLDPGVLGVTYMVNYYDLWYDMDILFSDYPENTGWHMLTNPDCEVTHNPTPDNGFSFYLVALHELGHGIGLGHDPIGNEPPGSPWFITTMNPGYPAGGPVGDKNIIELHTDDRRGTRFLYAGTPETKVDLANASYCAQGPTLGKAYPVFVEPAIITPGEELTAWVVIENFGTVSVTDVRQGFYLSTDGVVDPNEMLLGDVLWDLPADDGYEFSVGIDIPDVVAGTYYFGSILDDLDEVVEEYEDNNHVTCCDPFIIAQAVPSFQPFSQHVITCELPFTGPTPVVDYPINMAPVTWTLDNPQPGMTVDPNTGVIYWPNPIKSPFIYEIDLRATNAAGSSIQTLELGVHQAAPQIVPIANHPTPCGADYTGPTPQLTAATCMAPILNWSLVEGPPEMTINSSSGIVSWPNALPDSGPNLVTIRAINDVGETTESWLLYIASAEGDLDADGAVEKDDVDLFAPCLTGPSTTILGGCVCADFDQDEDVDLADYARLMTTFSGTAVPEGACCFEDGNCSVVTSADCYTLGGLYQGDGTTCATVSCAGACCFYTSGCLDFTLEYCNIAGGTFQGMGTLCADLTCPAAGEGACCWPNETCNISTPTDCANGDGEFQGAGMSCEVVDCSTPIGACCHIDGACSESTEADCLATSGTYMGDDTTCTADMCDGACCYYDGGCLDLSLLDCTTSAGTFEGPDTDCATFTCPVDTVGACCHIDETCTEETETRCFGFGGSYQGDEVECITTDCTTAAQGACCLPDESCLEVTQTACDWQSGTFIGAGTNCAGLDCSTSETGACYDPTDWSCTVTGLGICSALNGTYEGAGTTCAGTIAPEYRNDIANPTTYYPPGASSAMADDMTLSGTARGLTYYDLAVYGTGGGTYSVTAALYDGCPGEGGTLISDTQASWPAVPADDYIYTISADFSADPVRLPDTVWMVVTFSTANAGWVHAEEAETGFTDDLYGEDDPPWGCSFWFGGPPNDYAGFWADIQCIELPEPEGACCHADESCTEGLQSVCDSGGGMFMGEDTTCGTVDCTGLDLGACCDVVDWDCTITNETDCNTAGGSFDGVGTSCSVACPEYQNEIAPATLSYNPGQPMADDLTLAGTARDLSYYEIAVYGGGGGTFDVSAAFYDASPCSGGAQIPATLVNGYGLPDGEVLNLTVTLPTPVTLPDTPWLVLEFSNPYAGWIVAEEAEVGSTTDYFAMASWDGQQWNWACDYQIDDPPEDPHAGLWTNVQCIEAGKGHRFATGGEPVITFTPIDVASDTIRLITSSQAMKEYEKHVELLGTEPVPHRWRIPTSMRSLADSPILTPPAVERRRR